MIASRHVSGLTKRRVALAWVLAVVAPALTLGIRWGVVSVFGAHPLMILFVIPILLVGYVGGFWPGIAATACSAIATAVIHTHSNQLPFAVDSASFVPWLVLIANGVLISVVTEALHRARRRGESLPALEDQLKTLADTAPGVLYSFRRRPDGTFDFPFATRGLDHLLGLEPAAPPRDANDVFARTHPDDLPNLLRTISVSDHEKKPWHGEFRIQHPTRGEVWIEARSIPHRTPDGGTLWSGFAMDVTDRKRSERALQLSEERFRRALDNIPDVVVIYDRDLRIQFINNATRRITGKPPIDFIGKTDRDIWPAEICNAYLPALEESRRLGVIRTCEIDLTLPATGRRQLFITCVPVLDASGEVQEIVGVTHDFSERLRAEHALRESESRWRSYIESSPMAIYVVDRDGRYVDCNPAAVQLTGYDRDALLRMTIADICPEHDKARGLQVFEELKLSGNVNAEIRLSRIDGREIWVSLYAVKASEERFLGFCVDITEQKKTVEVLRRQSAALQAAANAIVITDNEGTILWVNPAFSQSSGFAASEAIGKNPRDLIHSGQQDAAFYEQMWRTILAGDVWRGEIVNKRKDGTFYTEEMTVTPVRNEAGHITNFVAIKQDISDKKQMEMQLLRTQRLESVGRLASGIAHDLNNILTPVLMAPPVLREAIQDSSVLAIVDSIEVSAKRGADIIRQLLAFGRGTSTRRLPISLRMLVRDMAKIMQETFPKNIRVHVEMPQDVAMVSGDATQLHQVMLNLCVNARDAMPGGGDLTLAIDREMVDHAKAQANAGAREGRHSVIRVTDTGMGIEPAVLDKIFDPFFTTKPLGEGTGLGLSTVMAIARGHDGFVTVESAVGKGTTFRVYVPEADIPHAAQPTAQGAPSQKGAGELVLVVDDETQVRIVISRLLERNGYRCIQAENGQQALDLINVHIAQRDSVRAVITDLMMPVMDGPTLIRELRKRDHALPILAISGFLSQPEILVGVEALTQGFLEKPIKAEDLLAAVHKALRR